MIPAKCSQCGEEFESSKLLLNHLLKHMEVRK